MNKIPYIAPLLRCIDAKLEQSFLTSGSGENANPGDGWWDDDDSFNN